MESKSFGGTFVAWRGASGEKVTFLRLSGPISEYLAEPWGGILIVTARPDHSDPEIIPTENLRRDLPKLSTRVGQRQAFWHSEQSAAKRSEIRTRLGNAPQYVG